MSVFEKSKGPALDSKAAEFGSILSRAATDVQVAQVLDISVTEEEDRKVLRKIDRCILPLMGFCYMLQLMDKTGLSYSTLLGLTEDVHLHSSEYSWCASIFYFGYLAWSWPVSYLVVRFPIGKYLSVSVLLWAGVLMCHAACNSFASLMVVRFFLGVGEASVAPGFSLITGMFYKRKEQPLRHGIWFAGNAIANIFGGVIAYGIGHVHSSHLAAWRVLFLILGGITAAYSVILFILLPDSPSKAVFLNADEKMITLRRVLDNKTGVMDEGAFKKSQMVAALKDPQAWLLFAYTFSINITNGGVSAFASLIVKGFGFNTLDSLLVQMPLGGAQLLFLAITAYLASLLRNCRLILMGMVVLISLIGMVMVYAIDQHNRSARLVGLCFSSVFIANIPLSLSIIASNVAGFTKKATVAAMLFMAYSLGNIVGPQFFFPREAPKYETGLRSSLAGLSLALIFLSLLYTYYLLENRRRDAAGLPEAQTTGEELLGEDEISNLTDREMISFRYVL